MLFFNHNIGIHFGFHFRVQREIKNSGCEKKKWQKGQEGERPRLPRHRKFECGGVSRRGPQSQESPKSHSRGEERHTHMRRFKVCSTFRLLLCSF